MRYSNSTADVAVVDRTKDMWAEPDTGSPTPISRSIVIAEIVELTGGGNITPEPYRLLDIGIHCTAASSQYSYVQTPSVSEHANTNTASDVATRDSGWLLMMVDGGV
jgi:hypothetical protein